MEKHLRFRVTGEDRASGTTDKVSKSMGGLITKIGTAAVAYAALRTISKAFGGTLRFVSGEMKYSIDNLAKEELATLRLAQAMKTGQSYTQEAYEGALKYAEAMERQTLYTADQVIAAEAMLATFKLQPDVLRTATKLTLDMATATGQDLVQASVLMGKAAVGVTGTLSRYGIIIDQTDLKLRGFAAVVDEINKEFGGQAQAMMSSYAGTVDQVGKAYDYLVDVFGDLIVKAPEVRALFRTTSDELYRMADIMGDASGDITVLSLGFKKLVELLNNAQPIFRGTSAAWNYLQSIAAMGLYPPWALKELYDVYKALRYGNATLEQAAKYAGEFTDKMELNLVVEKQLKDIRLATKDDLPELQKQLKTLSDTYGPANDQIGRQVEVVAALKGRIKELTAAYKGAAKAIKESYADTEVQAAYEASFTEWLEKRAATEEEFARAHYEVMTTEKQQEFDALDERLAAYGVFVKDRAALEEWYMLERQDILERYAPEAEETWTEHFGTLAQIQKRDFYDMAEQGMYTLTDTMVDAMWDMKVQFKDIWKAMMKDAMKYFFAKAALSFLGIFGTGGMAGTSSQMGDWTTGGPTYAQHGGRITGKDNIPVLAHYGERFVPEPQSTKYAPVLDRMISENRTGIPALGGGGGMGGDIYITIPVQTLDAKSFRESARHGMIQQEIAEALRRGYIDPRTN